MKVSLGTKVRTVALFIALINQVLVVLGYHPLPFDQDAVEQVVTLGFTGVTALWAWWKNNSFSKAAVKADNVLKQEKAKK
jgi:SPP1 family holin